MSTVVLPTRAPDNPPKPPKPRPAPERRITLLEPPSADTDGWFAFRIDFTSTMVRSQAVRTESWNYLAREIPAGGMGHGCRGFEVEKLDAALTPTGEVYHVLLNPKMDVSSCDCPGGEAHGHCKHRDGIQALIAAGHLEALPMVSYTGTPNRDAFAAGVAASQTPRRSAGDMKRNDPDELAKHLASIAEPEGPDQCPAAQQQPEPWDYPDEVPELPAWSDYEPGENGPDRAA